MSLRISSKTKHQSTKTAAVNNDQSEQCAHHMQHVGLYNFWKVGLHCHAGQHHSAVLHISLSQHFPNQNTLQR